MPRYRIEVKVADAIHHVKSGQDLSGKGLKDCEIPEGTRGWFQGMEDRGAIHIPTKAELKRAEPGRDLSVYENPEGEPEGPTGPKRRARREVAPAGGTS